MAKTVLIIVVVLLLCTLSGFIGWAICNWITCKKAASNEAKVTLPKIDTSGGPYSRGAVATDAEMCSKVGVKILEKNGSAVDAAIASMLCVGVINMHSTGITGSGFMLVYKRSTRRTELVNFREKAPGNSSRDMFLNKKKESQFGGAAIAVPGEVMGYYEAWSKYGHLKWKDLVQPAIDIAKNGFKIGTPVYEAADELQGQLKEDPGLRELLFDEKGNLRKNGTLITNLKYAATLEQIRDDPYSLYNGTLAKNIIRDMKDVKPEGLLQMEDLGNYSSQIVKAFSRRFDSGHVLHTAPPPTSGPLMNLILNILKGYNMTAKDRSNVNASSLAYHRIAEAFKFAFAYRSRLADPDFVNVSQVVRELLNPATGDFLRKKIWDNTTHHVSYYADFFTKVDHGTSHLVVLAPNGDAVSLTSSINFRFGCMFRSTSTGIIYNDGMADFDNPGDKNISGIYPSQLNFPAPGKRPLSSMTPVIITDKDGNVELIVGASGGKKILTATALTIIDWLWFDREISAAVEEPRIHTNLVPNNTLEVEKNFPEGVKKGLEARGHELEDLRYYAAVQAIATRGMSIYAKSDPRKHGKPGGF
ncbi:glutathione hydrolase 1 proenzyme-like [Actinia tenebrosa]|uniref:Glutathione hydrolase 1 proenzyme-like n=1 Tax=Actinia tenebrosa TaxID=6105 RepID=A0A6P8I069_ACTTE|nr:glutathione hydrolase 1 proenzyme-like [Actinia tenebrosa]